MQTAGRINDEHRKYNRYRLEAPVVFSWWGQRHSLIKGVGLTSVLSTHGAFVLTANPPPVKAIIDLKIFLPRIGAGVPMRFQGQGKVVRVEAVKHPDARAGFAVAAEGFALRKGPFMAVTKPAAPKLAA